MNPDPAFMELVQLHERTWGMEQYPGRPSLAELLSSPLIAMWSGDIKQTSTYTAPSKRLAAPANDATPARFMFSIHKSVPELDAVFLAMCVAGNTHPLANRKLFKIYLNQKPLKIKGIRLLVSEE